MKKIWKVLGIFLLIIIGVLVVNFIPTFQLKTKGMQKLEGEWINVYYETEESAARDVFEYADPLVEGLAKKLGFSEKQDVNIYIYDDQKKMQTKKYGYITPCFGLDWYIGDNIGTKVILTSPANPGKVHGYDDVKYAVTHEIVHAYVSVMNKDIALWLTEGMALYLSNGEPFYREYLEHMKVPTYKDTCTINPIRFADCGGYTFAHTYIEYLDKTYGWETVLELIKTEDYRSIYGKSKEEIYNEWVDYICNYYQ